MVPWDYGNPRKPFTGTHGSILLLYHSGSMQMTRSSRSVTGWSLPPQVLSRLARLLLNSGLLVQVRIPASEIADSAVPDRFTEPCALGRVH